MDNPLLTYAGSIPDNYEKYLVPVLFRPFAESMALRAAQSKPARVLELACGTGALTRCLAAALPTATRIVATDLSKDMLDVGARNLSDVPHIEWQVADACSLPFEREEFDLIACQFGAMSFPDRSAAMSEALRVLSPGGRLLFNTWGRIGGNPIFQIVETALTAMFPHEETPFMPTPFSMADPAEHRELLQAAGFAPVVVEEVTLAAGPHAPSSLAAGFAFGTPLGVYLSGQHYDLSKVHAALTSTFAAELGNPISCPMLAIVCHATKA